MLKKSNDLLPEIPEIVRKRNWKKSLDNFVEENKTTHFKVGSTDCALFARDCIGVMTGVYLLNELTDKYSNSFGTQRQLIKWGFQSVEDGFSHYFDQIPMSEARDGDLVIQQMPPLDLVGIVYKGKVLFKTRMPPTEVLKKLDNIYVEHPLTEEFVYYKVG